MLYVTPAQSNPSLAVSSVLTPPQSSPALPMQPALVTQYPCSPHQLYGSQLCAPPSSFAGTHVSVAPVLQVAQTPTQGMELQALRLAQLQQMQVNAQLQGAAQMQRWLSVQAQPLTVGPQMQPPVQPQAGSDAQPSAQLQPLAPTAPQSQLQLQAYAQLLSLIHI